MRVMVLAVGACLAVSGCASASFSDDALARFVERADGCAHWNGEVATDDTRGAEIDRNLHALRCTTITRDGEALKLSRKDRPEDLRRIDEALAGF